MAITPIAPGSTRLGWIGTGVMGRWMAEHLIRQGYALTAYNRSPAKLEPLLALGATAASSPAEVAAASDVVFAIVGMPDDVEEVFLGPQGALSAAKPDAILIDMTTSRPDLAVRIHAEAAAKGVHALDAPVTGGDVGARNATLSILVGGDEAVFAAVEPLFRHLGPTVVHHGGPGQGQQAKMVNQILIASNMVAIAEALLYGYRAGLDLDRVLESVKVGAGGSKALEVLGPRILARNFEPGFFVEHFIKDMGIALAEAERMHLCLPGLALAKQLYEALRAQGLGRKGTQALIVALERLSGVTR